MVLVFEFPNLTDLPIILVGAKACFLSKVCLSDKKSSLSSLLEDKILKLFGDSILLSLISFAFPFLTFLTEIAFLGFQK